MSSDLQMLSQGSSVIRADGLGKCYKIYENPKARIKQALWRGRKQYYREFWALRNVSFELKRGESLGIIGRNGSGKSTLLQLICGTLTATEGNVSTKGRIAALLELGSGFNPEFTGLENVYLNASLLGFSKDETDATIDEILAFADIGSFIDQPVKTYSSGMTVRLAFAVIAHIKPDILVVDEALSVGDTFFQQKCHRKIKESLDSGLALLFVSHDEAALKSFCTQGILLREGFNEYAGNIEECTRRYLNCIRSGSQQGQWPPHPRTTSNRTTKSLVHKCSITVSEQKRTELDLGTGNAKITDFWYANEAGDKKLVELDTSDQISLFVMITTNTTVHNPCFGYMLKNSNGLCVFSIESDSLLLSAESLPSLAQGKNYLLAMSFYLPPLKSGDYLIDMALADGMGANHHQCHWTYDSHMLSVVNPSICNGYTGSNKTSFSMMNLPHEKS